VLLFKTSASNVAVVTLLVAIIYSLIFVVRVRTLVS
jgi:hypothetical protein